MKPRKNLNSSATLTCPNSTPLSWKEGRKEGSRRYRTYYRINGVGLTDESVCFSCMFQEGWTYESILPRANFFCRYLFCRPTANDVKKGNISCIIQSWGERVVRSRDALEIFLFLDVRVVYLISYSLFEL